MNFGKAIDDVVHQGKRARRTSWKKEAFIFLVKGSTFKVNREPLLSLLGEGTEVRYHSHIDIKLPDGSICVYNPHHTDLTSNDWEFV